MLHVFTDLRFRWKIALPIIGLGLLLVLVGLVGMAGITRGVDASSRLTDRYLPAISLLLNADRDLYQAFVAERSMLADVNEAQYQVQLRSHAENLQQAQQRVRQYASMQPGAQALSLVGDFERGLERWKGISSEVVALSRNDQAAAVQLSFSSSEAAFDSMRATIDKLGELEDLASAGQGREAIARGEADQLQQAVIVALGLAGCLVLILGFPVLVTRPMQRLLDRITQIAEGDGDLRVRVPVHSADELGQLAQAFNRFLDKLQPLIAEVGRVTEEVAGSARDMAQMSAANERLIGDEHAAVDQVTTAATEMSAAVHEVAQNAQRAAEAAEHADAQSREGALVVGATIQAIRELAREMEDASSTIHALEQETSSIGAVLEVIRGIAEQTNLLALNAAIEAARAGEQGRGFAVVADEVRALAARTQESTKDINERIERLQHGVQLAVKAMQAGSSKASASVEQAAGVDRTLSVTGEAMQRINDMAAQIATACEEQSSVTEEIARNISDISDLSNQAAQMSQDGSRASNSLSEASRNLAQLVGRFKV
jgi:methyl-accepting chemotaxis protein